MADLAQGTKDIVARLSASIPTVDGNPVWVKWPNGPGNAPDDEHWIRLTIVPLSRNNVTADKQPWKREFGYITIDVFSPIGDGVNTNNDIQNQLLALFENQEFGVVKTLASDPQIIPEEVGSAWFGYQLNINFYVEGK